MNLKGPALGFQFPILAVAAILATFLLAFNLFLQARLQPITKVGQMLFNFSADSFIQIVIDIR
jgi:hypothetical protein